MDEIKKEKEDENEAVGRGQGGVKERKRKKKTAVMMTIVIRTTLEIWNCPLSRYRAQGKRCIAILFSPIPTSLIFCTRKRTLSVREVFMRGRASKGGICMCFKDGGDLVMVNKGISGLLVYMGLRSFFLNNLLESHFLSTVSPRTIHNDSPCHVRLRKSSSSGLLLKIIPQYFSRSEEFHRKYRDKVCNIRTTVCF